MTRDPDSPDWQRPPAAPEDRSADALGAVGLFGLGILSTVLTRAMGLYGEDASPLWWAMVVLATLTLPLAWRRRRPSWVVAVVAVAFVVAGETAVPETLVCNVALFMAIYTVGAWEPDRRRATWVRTAVIVVMALWLLTSFFRIAATPLAEELPGSGLGALTPMAAYMLQQLLINALYFAGAYWFGSHAWASARQRALVDFRTEQLAAEQSRLARQAVTLERLRIARELHDAVAHHVSLMGVQASAARAVLPRDPAAATTQLTAVEDSARSAVAELYQLLGTLRDDTLEENDGAAHLSASAHGPERVDEATATLGLEHMARLVAEADAAGVRTTLEVVGPPVPVPPLVELNLYRIAQESLTNVIKHAGPGTTATLRLRYLPHQIELEISDDGRGPAARKHRQGAGLGLVGMQERAATLAGVLEAGPRSSGGWLVRVTAPLTPLLTGSPASPSPALSGGPNA